MNIYKGERKNVLTLLFFFKKKARKLKQPTRNNNNNNRKTMDGWAGEDVNIFIKEEFDFQKNLDMFDKAKVFAEIRVK